MAVTARGVENVQVFHPSIQVIEFDVPKTMGVPHELADLTTNDAVSPAPKALNSIVVILPETEGLNQSSPLVRHVALEVVVVFPNTFVIIEVFFE